MCVSPTPDHLEAGFTLVAGQRVPAQGESCYESYDVELTYSLLLPADWDPALNERYAPMEFAEAVTVADHEPRPHILWEGWELIMVPAVDFAMP